MKTEILLNDEKYLEPLLKQVQEARPKELVEYEVGKTLVYSIISYKSKTCLQELKAICAPILKEHYRFEKKGEGKTLLLFGASYTKRSDHKRKFDKVASIIPNCSVISMYKNKFINIRNLLRMWRIPCWIHACSQIDVPKQLQRFIAYWWFDLYCQLEELKVLLRNATNPIEVFGCWCDTLSSDAIAVQYFNHQGIPTFTLQHAHFDIYELSGRIAYLYSPSRYFLCYGNYTAERAISIGMQKEKMIPLGVPDMIDAELPHKMQRNNKKIFALSLSFFSQREENIVMLQMAAQFAEQENMSCFVRPHPSLKMEEYQNYFISKRLVLAERGQSMEEFYTNADFVVLGASDVFVTMVSNLIPVFRYEPSKETDRFSGIDWCGFDSIEKLSGLYHRMQNDSEWMEQMLLESRNQLIGVQEAGIKYREFFRELEDKAYEESA